MSSNEVLLAEKLKELESLKERCAQLTEKNELLEEEKEEVQVTLASMNAKVQRYQSQADQLGLSTAALGEGGERVISAPGTKHSPKLRFSTPLHKHSICMELKDRLNEDRHLPSPLCEKVELSHSTRLTGRSALLPTYMSAWEMDVSGSSMQDYSLEMLKSRKSMSPQQADVDVKFGQLQEMERDTLQKEVIRLHRLNLELAEQCHKAELAEGELREKLTETEHLLVEETQKHQHNIQQEGGEKSTDVELKDLWRLVHNTDEESSESDTSLSVSTEVLKQQIREEITALRTKLNIKEAALKAERVYAGSSRKGRSSRSRLVDALNIDHVAIKRKSTRGHTETSTDLLCGDSLLHCNRTVPVPRKSYTDSDAHTPVPRVHFKDTTEAFEEVTEELDYDWCYEGVVVNKMRRRKDIPQRFQDDNDDRGFNVADVNGDSVDIGEMMGDVNVDCTKDDGANPVIRRHSYKKAVIDKDEQDEDGNKELTDFTSEINGGVNFSSNKSAGIQNSTYTINESHPDNCELPRARSGSFKAAMEQDHINSVSSISNYEGSHTCDTESSYSLSLSTAPKYSSTPLPSSGKTNGRFVKGGMKNTPNIETQLFKRDMSVKVPNHTSNNLSILSEENNTSQSTENIDIENQSTSNPSSETNHPGHQSTSSMDTSSQSNTGTQLGQSGIDSNSGAALRLSELESNTGAALGHSELECSAEVWSLTRSDDDSNSETCSGSMRDSGHSSTIESFERDMHDLIHSDAMENESHGKKDKLDDLTNESSSRKSCKHRTTNVSTRSHQQGSETQSPERGMKASGRGGEKSAVIRYGNIGKPVENTKQVTADAPPAQSDLHVDPEPVICLKPVSMLSKIRENHLARRRDFTRQTKMPQLSELTEKETAADNNNDPSKKTALVEIADDVLRPPMPNSDSDIMPSIPDEFLQKLGLIPDGKSSEELSEQEIESKFTSLSLAFKTDSQTLEKRLEIQERSRDIAEQNVDKELKGLRNNLDKLNQVCTDPEVREVLASIQTHINILEKSTARVSSRAEVFGAIQQEKRMSKAVDIMVHHVENIRRVHEREHAELEEARKLLQDSRSLAPTTMDLPGGGDMLSRRSVSVCQNNMYSGKASRRRVSEIALPKVLGGTGAATLHPSASMDARSRFQAAVAHTSMKSAVANTLRKASLEKQGNVRISPTPTPPHMSRENSSDSSAAKVTDVQDKEKQKNMEEEAFKKGYEQGLRANLGQDLSSLREQQNNINESLGEIMDSIDSQMEEPKSLREIFVEKFNETVPKVQISGWRIRVTFGCFFIIMAIISVIISLFPVSSASVVGYRHYGSPVV